MLFLKGAAKDRGRRKKIDERQVGLKTRGGMYLLHTKTPDERRTFTQSRTNLVTDNAPTVRLAEFRGAKEVPKIIKETKRKQLRRPREGQKLNTTSPCRQKSES